jgi:hypothetical protein
MYIEQRHMAIPGAPLRFLDRWNAVPTYRQANAEMVTCARQDSAIEPKDGLKISEE